jgi:hypothetical protein
MLFLILNNHEAQVKAMLVKQKQGIRKHSSYGDWDRCAIVNNPQGLLAVFLQPPKLIQPLKYMIPKIPISN